MEIQLQLVRLSLWLGGLIGIKSVFKPKGIQSAVRFDFNNAENGIYTINENNFYENMPIQKYGCLISFIDNNYYGIQFYIPLESKGNVYFRVRGSKESGWKNWFFLSGVTGG